MLAAWHDNQGDTQVYDKGTGDENPNETVGDVETRGEGQSKTSRGMASTTTRRTPGKDASTASTKGPPSTTTARGKLPHKKTQGRKGKKGKSKPVTESLQRSGKRRDNKSDGGEGSHRQRGIMGYMT